MTLTSLKSYLPKILIFLSIFLFFSFPQGDADLGWHLRYGESFLNTGHIMRDNQFSYELPDYQWANHSWGFDIISALLFNQSRFWLLSLTSGLIIALSIIILLPPSISLASISSMVVFFYFGNQLMNVGLRSQIFSFLFTAILWKIILKVNTGKFSPPQTLATYLLFLLWSNLHGQFIFGIGVLALFALPKLKHLPVLIGSVIATLINPFGFNLWTTAVSHLSSPQLQYIYEWMPWELDTPRMLLLLLYTAIFWWGISKTKLPTSIKLPLLAATILALFSRRIIPYYLLLSLPFFIQLLEQKLHQKKLIAITALLGFSCLIFYNRHLFSQTWDTYCQTDVLCSESAVSFMRANQIQGKLFNAYRIGGYLDYRYPEVKTMVDGRMTLWQDDFGDSPFSRYTIMVYTQSGAKRLFDAGNYDYVLIHPQYPLAKVLLNTEMWPVIYQDDKLLLFQNPKLIR